MPIFSIGKAKVNRKKGTAVLPVKVSGAKATVTFAPAGGSAASQKATLLLKKQTG